MRVLLDIGNTRLKWALHSRDGLSPQQALPVAGLTAEQLHQEVFAALTGVQSVRVSNVAGEQMASCVQVAAQRAFGLQAEFVTAAASARIQGRDIRNGYAQPVQLGVDRWLALLGAAALTHAPVLVVSIGTAMTLDALDAGGQHLGGMIVPGPALMTRSLLRHTSDIARRATQPVSSAATSGWFADNTLDCVEQGALRAAASLIAVTHAHLSATNHAELLLTGGAAGPVQSLLTQPCRHEPDLVLQGLALDS